MKPNEAIEILTELANGMNPITLEPVHEDRPLLDTKVSRALQWVIAIIEDSQNLPTYFSSSTTINDKIKVTPNIENQEEFDKLLEKTLRTYRTQQARLKKKWAPYVIFDNKTLKAIIDAKPLTMEKLLAVKGIGPKRAEHYGQDILDIIASIMADADRNLEPESKPKTGTTLMLVPQETSQPEQSWPKEEDLVLMRLCRENYSPLDILARYLDKDPKAIHVQLKELGLVD